MSFKSWLCFAEPAYEKELSAVESSEVAMSIASMSEEEKKMSEKLYAILVSVLKNRPRRFSELQKRRTALRVGGSYPPS